MSVRIGTRANASRPEPPRTRSRPTECARSSPRWRASPGSRHGCFAAHADRHARGRKAGPWERDIAGMDLDAVPAAAPDGRGHGECPVLRLLQMPRVRDVRLDERRLEPPRVEVAHHLRGADRRQGRPPAGAAPWRRARCRTRTAPQRPRAPRPPPPASTATPGRARTSNSGRGSIGGGASTPPCPRSSCGSMRAGNNALTSALQLRLLRRLVHHAPKSARSQTAWRPSRSCPGLASPAPSTHADQGGRCKQRRTGRFRSRTASSLRRAPAGLKESSVRTYGGPLRRFLRWMRDNYPPR